MNKKLLFGIMSLAALAACTNDDFDSQQQVAEGTSPIQFEVINNNASMRASMKGNKVVWSAADGDLFTLYHGGTCAADNDPLTAYQNATYKAATDDNGQAVLTTPTMINKGYAIMTWPADTTFRTTAPADMVTIKIPQNQTDKIQYEIPYVSDLIDIKPYKAYTEEAPATAFNTAGKDRKYSVYMRPMASQLNLKADYGTTEKQIAELYEGATGVATGEGIEHIKVTSVELLTTSGSSYFTTEIPLKFAKQTLPVARWNAADANNAWSHVTCFNVAGIVAAGQVDKLTTTYCPDNESSKFLILPQADIAAGGVPDGAVVVNTIYGKVVIADPDNGNPHATKYSTDEYNNAWYRYLPEDQKIATATTEENASEGTASDNGLYKTTAKNLQLGMKQTIDYMSKYVAKASLPVVGSEPIGVALTRYVNVNLKHLDMSNLHIKDDQQLRDAARVWKKLGLDPVTVYLDGGQEGDAAGEFTISQKTIEVINGINGAYNVTTNPTQGFTVKPCKDTGEECTKIIITGSDYKQDVQDIAFIVNNGGTKADVVLAKETKAWMWTGTVKVAKAGVNQIVNKGTMENRGTAILKTVEFDGSQNSVKLRNEGTWNIKSGTLNVQFDVTNIKEVNISKGAQYRQDGAVATYFTNTAVTLPQRFLTGDAKEMIGVVNNYGVFASVNKGGIVNYGLIEHADKDAKTYILRNQQGGNFNSAFDTSSNRMGRINLKYGNKDEDNISISAAAAEGFVSVTVTADDAPTNGILNADVVGKRVNYIIVNGGINEIATVSPQVKYIEINDPSKKQPNEIVWSVANSEYEGLIVLSDVNITLNTTINVKKAAYLGADMYVGGTLKYNGGAITDNLWKGYYGDTSTDYATKYITY